MEIGIWSLVCSIVLVFPVFPIANNMSMWEWFKTGMLWYVYQEDDGGY